MNHKHCSCFFIIGIKKNLHKNVVEKFDLFVEPRKGALVVVICWENGCVCCWCSVVIFAVVAVIPSAVTGIR